MGFELGTVAAIASLAGTGISAISQIEQGQKQQSWYNYNAAVARQQAEASRKAADYEATQKEKAGEAFKARQRTLFLKSGVELSGTPESTIIGTAEEIARDAAAIRYKGEIGGLQSESSATLSQMQGGIANAAGTSAGIGSLLTGAASSVNSYYGLKYYQSRTP